MILPSAPWKEFWERQTTPLHSKNTEEFYRAYARELRLILEKRPFQSVLDIGCGDGSLFPHLGFDCVERYVGVDLSNRLLSLFAERFPQVDLICSEGEKYRDERKYDLILTSGVVQYFSRKMFAEHLQNACSMLAEGGRIMAAGIPWRVTEYSYRSGQLTGHPRSGLRQYVKSLIAARLENRMGRWYHHQELRSLAKKHHLRLDLHGSIHYPYRLHAVFSQEQSMLARA